MSAVFSFFLRLFLCLVAAKFFLHAVAVEGRGYLIGLTVLLLANVYWLSYLVFRDRGAGNLLPSQARPRNRGGEPEKPSEPRSSGA